MSDQARCIIEGDVGVDAVADALAQITGLDPHVDCVVEGSLWQVTAGDSGLMKDMFAVSVQKGDLVPATEVFVYSCEPSREVVRALAERFGGRYRGSDYDDAWTEVEAVAPPAP